MSDSKTFRLFISSTFNDFKREREILQTKVFPIIQEYASSQGYTFQPIDLRWGVSNEAQLDQKTLTLCLNEVRACKVHPYPNFLIMIGDRYGWIPLPYIIEEKEFELILKQCLKDERELLTTWYIKDFNQLPTSYILKERSDRYSDFSLWTEIETLLRSILQKAVKQSNIDEKSKKKYFLSATEAEVQEGIILYDEITAFQKKELLSHDHTLKTTDKEHIFGFIRNIDKHTKQGDLFISQDYIKAQQFKDRVSDVLIKENRLSINTYQVDNSSLDETYLQEFTNRILDFLHLQIDTQKKECDNMQLSFLQQEIQEHKAFAQQKRKNFIAQTSLRQKIKDYCNSDNDNAFILYGNSGIGKSALMAKTIEELSSLHKSLILYRFVGATANAASSRKIWSSFLQELDLDTTEIDKIENFELFSQRIHDEILQIKKQVIFFIDAVDQLEHDDPFLWLPEHLPKNIKIVISALDDHKYVDASRYFKTLKSRISNLHMIGSFKEAEKLMLQLLRQEDRTIQPEQKIYFLEQYRSANSPLYVNVAAQEIKNWKSYDYVQGSRPTVEGKEQDLRLTQEGIIEEFIDNLTIFYHHDKNFVHKVLGYLYASHDGLSESELLQLISIDKSFIQQITPNTWHENPNQEFPLVYYSRLYVHLKPFLSIKKQNNEELIYFFHREFEEVLHQYAFQKDIHISIIKATQLLIKGHQTSNFNTNRWGKLYITLLTGYHMRYSDKFYTHVLFITSLTDISWIKAFIEEMIELGYNFFLHNQMFKAIAYQENCLALVEVFYQKDSKTWDQAYIRSLNNLALTYSTQNRLSEAITFQRKNLDILIQLSSDSDDWYVDLFYAKNNLAISCQTLNHFEEALQLQEENLTLTKQHYKKEPKVWGEYYILALNNLALSYRNQNKLQDAINLLKQSLELTKPLFEKKPLFWTASYTRSLLNLGLCYSDQNLYDDATLLQQECVDILKIAFNKNSNRWIDDYVKSMINLGITYYKQNKLEKAITLQELTIDLITPFYKENSARWLENYTLALNNLALSYSEFDRLKDALDLQEKNLSNIEKSYTKNPNRWAEVYILALNNLAVSYLGNEQLEQSLSLQEKTYKIVTTFFYEDKQRWSEHYTRALKNLSISYFTSKRIDEAIDLQQQNIVLTQPLYDQHPLQWIDFYGGALDDLANSYTSIKKEELALELKIKRVKILKAHCEINSQLRFIYVSSLSDLASFYFDQEKTDDAIKVQEQNIKYIEIFYKTKPDEWQDEMGIALHDMANYYLNNDQLNHAIDYAQNALRIAKKLYDKSPKERAGQYSLTMDLLIECYSNNDQLDKAILLQEENLYVMKKQYTQDIDGWEAFYAEGLQDITRYYKDNDQLEKAIEYALLSLPIMKKLFNEDPQWADKYSLTMDLLAEYYADNGQLKQAISLQETNLSIMRKQYEQGIDGWEAFYTRGLQEITGYYKDNNQLKKAVDYAQKSLPITKKLYRKDPQEWASRYSIIMDLLTEYYANNDELKQAILLQEENLSIMKEQYELAIDDWDEFYAEGLQSAIIYCLDDDQEEKVLQYAKRALPILTKLYEKAPQQFEKFYNATIELLAEYDTDTNQ